LPAAAEWAKVAATRSPRGGITRTTDTALRPETAYLVIGLIAGLLATFVIPPLKGADEPAHWYRAYQLSEGAPRARRDGDRVGGVLPAAVRFWPAAEPDRAAAATGTAGNAAAPGDRVFVDFRNTAVFPPVAYLPQALAIAVGRALGLEPPALFRAARLAGLAAALALTVLAIRVAPIGKRVLLLLALTPMAIRQMSVLSADTVTNAAALLLVALCLRRALRPAATITGRDLVPVLACALVVSLAKVAYLPLTGLVFLGAGRGRRQRWLGRALVVAVCLVATAGWLWLARDSYVAQRIAPDADPQRQLAVVLADPLRYLHLLAADLHRHWAAYLNTGTGYTSAFPAGVRWTHLGLIAALALLDGRADAAIGGRGRGLLAAVFVATYVLVNTLNYLGWNAVGASTLQFVQGRYYIPILPLPFLLLTNRRWAGLVSDRRLTAIAAAGGALFAAMALYRFALQWHGG
jgi:uncharacterized membrane protein